MPFSCSFPHLLLVLNEKLAEKLAIKTCTKAVLKKTSRANSSPYGLHFPVCSQASTLSQPSSNLPASVPSLAATTPS